MVVGTGTEQATSLLEIMRSRRVCRNFTDELVRTEDIRTILKAARWASSAGNRRINKFLVVRDPQTLALVKAVSPGMLARPPAIIVILTDLDQARVEQVQLGKDFNTWIDVGTTAMNMMLMAHALGLGSCPATSFSKPGIAVALDLPSHLTADFILQIGHRAPETRAKRAGATTRLDMEDLTYWERCTP
jgi:nitroreductase